MSHGSPRPIRSDERRGQRSRRPPRFELLQVVYVREAHPGPRAAQRRSGHDRGAAGAALSRLSGRIHRRRRLDQGRSGLHPGSAERRTAAAIGPLVAGSAGALDSRRRSGDAGSVRGGAGGVRERPCALFRVPRRRGGARRLGPDLRRRQCRERELPRGQLRRGERARSAGRGRRAADHRGAGGGGGRAAVHALRRLPPAPRRVRRARGRGPLMRAGPAAPHGDARRAAAARVQPRRGGGSAGRARGRRLRQLRIRPRTSRAPSPRSRSSAAARPRWCAPTARGSSRARV